MYNIYIYIKFIYNIHIDLDKYAEYLFYFISDHITLYV